MPRTVQPAQHSRWLALSVLCAGMLMVILDGSVVTVALPAIQQDLDFSDSALTWTLNAYLLSFGGLLLLAGRIGDLLGRKRIFLAGLAVFTLASLLCGIATDPGMLIAARTLQGVGGAMTSAVSLGMIVTMFPEPAERTKALGAFSFTGATGASIGQVLGGVLTDALSWNWIFLINLPIGVAAALLGMRILRSDQGSGLRGGADMSGALLVTAGLMLGVYTIVKTDEHGWTSPHTLALGGISLLLIAAFVLRQAKAAAPLLPLRMFRHRNVSGGNAVQLLAIAAMFGFQVLAAQYLQGVLGYSAAETGLAMLPVAVLIGGISLGLSARLINRFGERAVLLTGLGLVTAGLVMLARVPVDASFTADLLPAFIALGGTGLVLPSLAALGMSGAGPADAGVASGLFNTTQQIGGALGVAVLSTLVAGRAAASGTEGTEGTGPAQALTDGYHLAFGTGAGLALAAAVVAVTVLRTPGRGSQKVAGAAKRTAAGPVAERSPAAPRS